jgi:multiple sugar transport system substrate-binding protein
MRPFQIILLAIFGLLALGGLALFSTYKGNGGGSGAKVGTVIVWGTLPQTALDGELNAIKTEDQSYNGITYVQKPDANFDQNLSDAIASGNGPDLILVSQEHLAAEQNKISTIPYSSISERTYLDSFVPEAELYLNAQGTYGIPFVIDPLILFYNKDALDSAGVVTPPKTWETVTGLASQLTTQSNGQISRSVIPFGTYENVLNARAIVSMFLLQSGSSIADSTNGSIRSTLAAQQKTDLGGLSPAESAINFYTQFANPAKSIYTWNSASPEARLSFTSGALVFYPGFASEIPTITATNPNLNFDIAPVPQPKTSSSRVTFGNVYAFSIPKASHNASGAYLASVALAAPAPASSAAKALSMAPATRSALASAPHDRFSPLFYPEALISRGWLSPVPAVTDQIFSTMIRSITSGRAQTADAVQTASQAIDSSY